MKSTIKLTLAASAVVLLAACGGGGGGSASGGSASVDPQGIWSGPASTGYTVNSVILETGETWGFYTSGSTIYGALYGTAAVNGSSISINGTDFNFLNNSSSSGNLSGSVITKTSMSLSGNGITVPLTYQSTYDNAATTSGPIGTWSFIGRSGSYSLIPASITIDATGKFVLNQTNCVTTGSIVPRAGGKNIYNVNLAAVGIGCAAGQNTLSGVAFFNTTVTPNQFYSLALNPSKSDGLIVIGTKQQ